jgi:hypothetical protein
MTDKTRQALNEWIRKYKAVNGKPPTYGEQINKLKELKKKER